MTATIQETIASLHDTLQGYIEATYHIADPKIVAQRRALLRSAGGIFQTPYVESTPRYVTGKTYAEMTDIPAAAREAYGRLAAPATGKPLLFDPPYSHQAESIRTILHDRRNVMIMTGTGSGKTESFLLPILGKLAIEAKDQSAQFAAHSAVRAMVLYPMNALVNDQLGRLRTLFGDPRLVEMFQQWAGRAATFARYTSRTPYAGVRTKEKDGARLRSIGDFFVNIEDAAKRHADGTPIVESEDARAAGLMGRLHDKGKWPAKPSVSQWFGSGRWMAGSAFRRAVTLDDDAELMTRYEIQQAPPDLLITNYSMLEYMMLRPIERSIFEATRAWLEACPNEKFLIVLDEAHLYRGAQGAEVGLLLRRLRERLAIPPERFQVICATASFSDAGKAMAGDFGAQLTGVDPASFTAVTGDLKLREGAAKGDGADLADLAAIDLDRFFSEDAADRSAAVAPFLNKRGVTPSGNDEADLFHALKDYPPFALLVNETMRRACALDELPELVFDHPAQTSGPRAINTLLAMGSRARLKPDDASLLPCRVHAFYRGLPGLWACMDPDCTVLDPSERGGPIGKLYAQPRDRCGCGAPVLAYFTCRYCGTSYARVYTKDVGQPDHLFAEPGQKLITSAGVALAFQPLDLMLEAPGPLTQGVAANYDLASGLLNPDKLSTRHRLVYLRPQASGLVSAAVGGDDDDEDEGDDGDDGSAGAGPGQFVPCGCCGRSVRGGKASVQDHVTKGDQPFQALISAQIRVQPPSPAKATEFAPLRGRKVLVFSDSRQVAARLAPALQVYSLKDTLRALLPLGYRMLGNDPVFADSIVLDNAWLATVVAAHKLSVRLRAELEPSETMPAVPDTPAGAMPSTKVLISLFNQEPPTNLIRALVDVLRDNILGLEALAVASIVEAESETAKIIALPSLAGLAETPEDKLAVARAWLRAWSRKSGIWFRGMPNSWWGTGGIVRSHRGDFRAMQHVLGTPALKKTFKKEWVSRLMPMVTEQADGGSRLLARKLSLRLGGEDWRRCARCTSVHRTIATVPLCIDCGSADVHGFDPDADPVFLARKGFYRGPVIDALGNDEPDLMSIIAAEHTAQLNAARPDAAFSQAEHHEMQFQDIDLSWRDVDQGRSTSIDVLSSTTTMEVGIDIGDLSGVALRNMPPGRANYQQRAGRAGRRGNAVATVVAFGSADSHDDHYFTRPQEMIRGQVVDPRLTLENPDIARRHIRAFLLQRYHEHKLPTLNPSDPALANLFSVLGTVGDFIGTGPLNRLDLQAWLNANEGALRDAVDGWLPSELSQVDRTMLLDGFIVDLLGALDLALEGQHDSALPPDPEGDPESTTPPWLAPAPEGTPDPDQPAPEADPAPDDDKGLDAAADNLLDRLLYWGVLPRYAFPTDVAPFYVFSANSTGYRAEMEFAPSQGLNLALSQYAPNKQIWIKGKQYTSKAIYSPFPDDRRVAWGRKRLYYECDRCGHAKTEGFYDPAKRGERLTCEACHTPNSFGPAKPWFRPPGFAHLWKASAPSVPDEPNETAYATRAKLVMTADGTQMGAPITGNIRALATRQHLLVSNSGPDSDGYDYCVRCGRIESSAAPEINLTQPHPLPYPNDNDPLCPGFSSRGIVLGTDFPTDIALFALRLDAPFRLIPAYSETLSAMRTVCEALAKAASLLLEIEPGEVLAEYRPALNDHGAAGSLVEVFLYDTLAGGAGFSPQLVPRGKELFEVALTLLESCPEQCDASCYRCLRSFRNKLDHALLDRFVGAQLLRHLIHGDTALFDQGRAARSLAILAADLRRQLPVAYIISQPSTAAGLSGPLRIQDEHGKVTQVDIHSPITPGIPIFGSADAVLVDDLRVRRHLGEEIERILPSLT